MSPMCKIAVIGAGQWGKNYVKNLYDMGILAAIVDPSEAVRHNFSVLYPEINITGDYLSVLNDPQITHVVIATPAPTHYTLAKEFLLAGKDVLLEKPMTLKTAHAVELHQLAARCERILMVGHVLLYKPAIQKIIQYVKQRKIGAVQSITMQRIKMGKLRNQENVLWSFAPHDIAVLLALVDSQVKHIHAHGHAMVQPNIEDDVYLHIEFVNGVQAHLHVSWLSPEDHRGLMIVGDKGMLVYNENENSLKVYNKSVDSDLNIQDNGIEQMQFAECNILKKQIMHFIQCTENRSTPVTDSQSGVAVTKLLVDASSCLQKEHAPKDFFAHPSAYVDDPIQIGAGTQIWHNSHIMAGAVIGEQCKIGQNVFIAGGAKIGDNVKIQNNVSVYQGVILENDVFCGPSMVFTNVRTPRSGYPRNTEEDYLTTLVKQGASIGANATIRCGVVIGKHALIGAGAVITKDVPDHAVVYGNPAQVHGWICKCGEVISKIKDHTVKCDACGTDFGDI